MPINSSLNTPKMLARKAGVLYLVIAIFGAFAIAYVPSQIIVPGDAEATLAQLRAQTLLFRAGIFADFVVIALEIALTAVLYFLLRPVDPVRSMIAALARFAMTMVMTSILLINVVAFSMAQGALQGSPQTILTLFDIHAQGVFVWGVLFGIHLLLLGSLICQSGYFPKLLGGALFIGGFGYLFEGISQLMGVEHAILSAFIIGLLVLVTIAELGFALWLVVKGLNEEKWQMAQLKR